jgi:hypothetical protein
MTAIAQRMNNSPSIQQIGQILIFNRLSINHFQLQENGAFISEFHGTTYIKQSLFCTGKKYCFLFSPFEAIASYM